MELTPPILEGKFVRLEPLAEKHVGRLAEIAVANAEIFRWFPSMPVAGGRDKVEAMLRSSIEAMAKGQSITFVTHWRASGEIVGSSSYGAIDTVNRRLEIGWTWVKRAFQRGPVNTEAKLLMLAHAFEKMGCIRVEFKTHHRNEQSQKALERIGAKKEGVFRNHMIMPDGSLRHSVYYSIIMEEWPQAKAALQAMLARGGGEQQ
jgi:RimJ/RimL family protein N-acetyltransferase